MVLDININYRTKPIVKEVNRSSTIKKFFFKFLAKRLEILLNRSLSRLNSKLDSAILKVEGSHNYIKKLDSDEANKVLVHIKKSTVELEKAYNNLDRKNFFDDKALKVKFKYLLKSIYKSEAIAHKIAYTGKEILKTDESIKDGIIKMNSNFFKESV